MKRFKKWGVRIAKLSLALITLMIVLVAIGSTLLYYNQDKLYQMAIHELNENKQGFTSIEKITLAPFKAFPYVSVDLNNVLLKESEHATDTVAFVKDFYVGFDLWAILKGKWEVKKMSLEGGGVFVVIDSLGVWNITNALKPVDTLSTYNDENKSVFNLELSSLSIRDFVIEEHNLQGNKYLKASIQQLNTNIKVLNSNLSMSLYAQFFLNEYSSSGVTFFKDKNVSWSSSVVQSHDSEWSIEAGSIDLDEGNLDFQGVLNTADDWFIDLSLAGTKNNFNLFLNLLPNDLYANLKRYRNQGKVFFNGSVKGPLIKGSPAVFFELGCSETSFVNLQNNASLDNISFVGVFSTGDSNNAKSTFFELKQLYAVANKGIMKGTFRVENFEKPQFTMRFKADLDVEDLLSFYDPKWVDHASGKLRVDLNFSEYVDSDSLLHVVSTLQNQQPSFIELADFSIHFKDDPLPFVNSSARLEWKGDEVALHHFKTQRGESVLDLSGSLSQFHALVHGYDIPVLCSVRLASQRWAFNEMNVDSSALGALWNEVLYDAELDLNASVWGSYFSKKKVQSPVQLSVKKARGRLKYYDLPLNQAASDLIWTGDTLFFSKTGFKLGKNDLAMDGYVALNQDLGQFRVFTDVQSAVLDLKELLVYKGASWFHDEINQYVDQEKVESLNFHLDALLTQNPNLTSGYEGFVRVKDLKGVWNDFLPVSKSSVSGFIDSVGSLVIPHFSLHYGKSDLSGNLNVSHLFASDSSLPVLVQGKLFSSLLDWDQIVYNSNKAFVGRDLNPNQTQPVNHDSGFNAFVLPFPVASLSCEVGHLKFNKYSLKKVHLDLRSTPNHYIFLDSMSFLAASGKVNMKGYFNGSNPDRLYTKLALHINDVNLNEVFYKLDNLGQDYLIQDNIQGVLSASVDAFFRMHRDFTPDLSDATAEIDLLVRDGVLIRFKPLLAMSDFLGNRNLNAVRFGELQNSLSFRNGKVFIPNMQISSSIGYLYARGYHSPDTMNYELDLPLSLVREAGWGMVRSKLGGNKNKNQKDSEDLDRVDSEIISTQKGVFKRYLGFYLMGNEHDFEVRLGKIKRVRE